MSTPLDFSTFPDTILKKIGQHAYSLVKSNTKMSDCFGPNIYLLEGTQLPLTTAKNQVYVGAYVKQIKFLPSEKIWVQAEIVVGVTLDNEQTMAATESPMNGTNIFFYLMTLFTSDTTDVLVDGGKQLNVACNELSMDWAPLPKETGYRLMRCHVLIQTYLDPTTGNLIYGG